MSTPGKSSASDGQSRMLELPTKRTPPGAGGSRRSAASNAAMSAANPGEVTAATLPGGARTCCGAAGREVRPVEHAASATTVSRSETRRIQQELSCYALARKNGQRDNGKLKTRKAS